MMTSQPRISHLLRRLRKKRYWPFLLLLGLAILYFVFPPPHTDILVLGIDGRAGEGWAARADSIMLVGIEPRSLGVSMMSIPRDLSVEVPWYGLQRVNTVNMLGEMEDGNTGPALMKAAVAQSFGVTPERYVRLNFSGFVGLVDAVGGVTIDVTHPIVDYNYPTEDFGVKTVEFEIGVQHMDGERALIYARTRYADDDYRRAERQQQVVSALLGRMINPLAWPAVAGVLSQSVDTDLSAWDLLTLAPAVLIGGGRADRLVIDRDLITATAEGVAVPDYEQLAPWVQAHFD
ncbi:MAG: LCP family protein [Anaerolineae bacterium]|nr:LCP family protein [Anaerolineae bacterium]